MYQDCHRVVTGEILEFAGGVTGMLQKCYRGVTGLLQECYRHVICVLLRCYEGSYRCHRAICHPLGSGLPSGLCGKEGGPYLLFKA